MPATAKIERKGDIMLSIQTRSFILKQRSYIAAGKEEQIIKVYIGKEQQEDGVYIYTN